MTLHLDRRRFCAGLGVFAAIAVRSADARDARGLDGTWGGADKGVTAQVIIVGKSVVGFFWHGDYLDAQSPEFSADGRSLSFAFPGGKATLTLTDERSAQIAVTEGGNVVRLHLRRD